MSPLVRAWERPAMVSVFVLDVCKIAFIFDMLRIFAFSTLLTQHLRRAVLVAVESSFLRCGWSGFSGRDAAQKLQLIPRLPMQLSSFKECCIMPCRLPVCVVLIGASLASVTRCFCNSVRDAVADLK